jgi:fido (protein-threonine AMPylation protein)
MKGRAPPQSANPPKTSPHATKMKMLDREHRDLTKFYSPPKWNSRANPEQAMASAASIGSEWERIAGLSEAEKIHLIIDTRDLHRRIFSGCTPEGCGVYAGEYRGADNDLLIDRHATLKYSGTRRRPKIHLAPPHLVLQLMVDLGNYIRSFAGHALSRADYIHHVVKAFVQFNKIHPYLDGNGRISRIFFGTLLSLEGIRLSEKWTFDNRPFDSRIDILFRHYHEWPEAMEEYLSTWID